MIIQNRGQDSAGISVYDGMKISTVKDVGLVQTALPKSRIENLSGKTGIGHVRYATTGSKGIENAQPMTMVASAGMIAVAHNGDITNYDKLKAKYMESGSAFQTSSDTELIIKILSKNLGQNGDYIAAIRATMGEIGCAYALALMINGRLFGIRDPCGIRPLIIGKLDDGYMVVSESAAVDALGGEIVRDVMPGEIVELTKDGIKSYPPRVKTDRAYCMFEWVYFARPDSVIDGMSVYQVRRNIGRILAREHPCPDADLVMPIPDSGRAHAIGFSNEKNREHASR